MSKETLGIFDSSHDNVMSSIHYYDTLHKLESDHVSLTFGGDHFFATVGEFIVIGIGLYLRILPNRTLRSNVSSVGLYFHFTSSIFRHNCANLSHFQLILLVNEPQQCQF